MLPGMLLCLYSCKKEEKTKEAPIVNVTSPALADLGTFTSNYYTKNYSAIGGSIYNDSSIYAAFYTDGTNSKTYLSAGTVSVNNILIPAFNNPIFYSKTNGVLIRTLNWHIGGNGTITACNFSYTPNYPNYEGQSLLPDSVNKISGINFTVSSVSNLTGSLILHIEQNSTDIIKTITTFPSIVSVTQNEMNSFNDSTFFNLRFSFINYSHITLNGYQYGINASRSYLKYVYLKP